MNAGELNMSRSGETQTDVELEHPPPEITLLTSKIIATIISNPGRMQVEIMPASHEYQNQ